MSGFAVRAGIPEDAEKIAAVFVETWRATYPGILPDRVLIKMSDEAQAFYWSRLLAARRAREFVRVAVNARNALLGFGSAGPGRAGTRNEGEIYTLYVRPDFQNRGIGRALICALLRGLRERGCYQAMLWVLAQNPSRFFYEAMGGKRNIERTERLWGVDVPQIGYRWGDLASVFAEGGPCARRT
jgi:ribosomal protein S18 acetylase RimI-like enzyme